MTAVISSLAVVKVAKIGSTKWREKGYPSGSLLPMLGSILFQTSPFSRGDVSHAPVALGMQYWLSNDLVVDDAYGPVWRDCEGVLAWKGKAWQVPLDVFQRRWIPPRGLESGRGYSTRSLHSSVSSCVGTKHDTDDASPRHSRDHLQVSLLMIISAIPSIQQH